MAHTYTPGLKVSEKELITKKRILPLKGDVIVKVGDQVHPDDVVARTHLPGPVETTNVAKFGRAAGRYRSLHAKQKATGQGNEVIAMSKSFSGVQVGSQIKN
jgi:hypothetical protein